MGSRRIAFDMDGVLADMESELVRQAIALFGDAMTREPAERVPDTSAEDPGERDRVAGAETSRDETPPSVKWKLTSQQQRRLWQHVASIGNFWETLDEIEPGTVNRLASIAGDRRWEVIFLTKRPETAGATAQVQSQRWLVSKGFALPSVYVVQASRGRIAAALDLDAVVDDRPENCLDVVVDSGAAAILVRRDNREPLPAAVARMGIGVVTSMKECLDALVLPTWSTLPTSPSPAAGPSSPTPGNEPGRPAGSGSRREPPGLLSRMMRALGRKEPVGGR
jgi:hypothetical protein